jgi:hypothetical protein
MTEVDGGLREKARVAFMAEERERAERSAEQRAKDAQHVVRLVARTLGVEVTPYLGLGTARADGVEFRLEYDPYSTIDGLAARWDDGDWVNVYGLADLGRKMAQERQPTKPEPPPAKSDDPLQQIAVELRRLVTLIDYRWRGV